MRLATLFAVAVVVAGDCLVAAPVPSEPDAKSLVAGLSDLSEKVRDEAAAALKNRVDALPWLRRAARSADKDIAKRATALLTPYEPKRQEEVAKAIDACVRDGRIDMLTEWHQYWKPRAEEDLWPVGPRAAKAGLDLYAKSCSKEAWKQFEQRLDWAKSVNTSVHNGPCPDGFEAFKGAWLIRTDRMDQLARKPGHIRFASVAGPVQLTELGDGAPYLVLGPVEARHLGMAFVACDGGIGSQNAVVRTMLSVVVCRGPFTGHAVFDAVLLVDGDVDLTRANEIRNSLIRATGEIRVPKNGPGAPVNCNIEAQAKDATSPYKFFELADAGLSVVAGKEGVVVTAVKADTPFGNCGLAKGDIIVAIDDTPAGHSELFRKKVRKAMVVQGDCLLTVVRGRETRDLPVYFPLPK